MSTAETLWSFPLRLAFRFFLIFYMLTLGITVLSFIPGGDDFSLWLMNLLVPFTAKYLLGIEEAVRVYSGGSGDKLGDWVSLLVNLLLSVFGTALWSILDRKRTQYSTLYEWSRVFFRYLLAFTMFAYGFAKVFHAQMPAPSLSTLMKPYGNASPMNLLWTFVGYSAAYSAYTGWAEVLGGIFLLFRRTTLLGALVTGVVMFNVFVLNMCFDVPVKIFSFLLTTLTVYIAAPDLKYVWDLFFSGRSIPERPVTHLLPDSKLRKGVLIVKFVLLALMFGFTLWESLSYQETVESRPPLYGIYDVKMMEKNGQLQAPLCSDSTYWRKLMVNWEGSAGIRMANDSTKAYVFKVDTALHQVLLHPRSDTMLKSTLLYHIAAPGNLELMGVLGSDSVRIRMERFDERNFLLNSRGFHWVSEMPFNR